MTTMDLNVLEEKLKLWEKKRTQLQAEYEDIMVKRGEAMAMGDLRENAAFQMLDEDASTYRVKLEEVDKIITNLKKQLGIK